MILCILGVGMCSSWSCFYCGCVDGASDTCRNEILVIHSSLVARAVDGSLHIYSIYK